MAPIVYALVTHRSREEEQEMSHNKFDQFNDLVTRLAAADGTVTAERSQELLDTALTREVLAAIVGGVWPPALTSDTPLGAREAYIKSVAGGNIKGE
jgi:hypothetical protein